MLQCVCSCECCLPLLSVSVGLLVRRQLDDENAGLSVLKALLVVGRLWRALGVQHKDLGHKKDIKIRHSIVKNVNRLKSKRDV